MPADFKGLKSAERCGLENAVELGDLKRSREPGSTDDFYSKRMKLRSLDDANIDEHTRKVQASNWTSNMYLQKLKVSALQFQFLMFICR
jgi:hypothetical protein